MNIVQFSLLTLLAYVLQCNGQYDCGELLLSRIKALSPLVAFAQLGADVAECQNSLTTTVSLSQQIANCVTECNAYRNPNAVPCTEACWAEGPTPSPACLSVVVDVASIVATVGFPESKVATATLDGLSFLQCIATLQNDGGPKPVTTTTSTTTTTTTSTTTTMSTTTTTSTTTSTSATSCPSSIPATITCSPGDAQPTVVPCDCCFENLCSKHPIQCSCLCACTS